MKISIKHQYALLFTLYLCRAGRAKIQTVSEELDISHQFLQQVAHKLRVAGLIKSVRGPGGGYEVIGEPTVGQVFAATGRSYLPTLGGNRFNNRPEKRALANLVDDFCTSLYPVLRRKIKDLNIDLAVSEVVAMEQAGVMDVVN